MNPTMTDDEAVAISEKIALILVMCRGLDSDKVKAWVKIAREQQSRHDTWTAMVDPTAWTQDKEGIYAVTKVAVAFGEFHAAVIENVNDR